MQSQLGTVYIVQLERPLGNPNNKRARAAFYVGWALDVEKRLAEHRAGRGAKMLAAAAERGIGFDVILKIEGDRNLERSIKNLHNTPRFVERTLRQAVR